MFLYIFRNNLCTIQSVRWDLLESREGVLGVGWRFWMEVGSVPVPRGPSLDALKSLLEDDPPMMMPHSNLLQFNRTNSSFLNKPPHSPSLSSQNSMTSSPPFGHYRLSKKIGRRCNDSWRIHSRPSRWSMFRLERWYDRETCSRVLGKLEPRSWWKLTKGDIEKGMGWYVPPATPTRL